MNTFICTYTDNSITFRAVRVADHLVIERSGVDALGTPQWTSYTDTTDERLSTSEARDIVRALVGAGLGARAVAQNEGYRLLQTIGDFVSLQYLESDALGGPRWLDAKWDTDTAVGLIHAYRVDATRIHG